MTRYINLAGTAARRFLHICRRLNRAVQDTLSTGAAALWFACAAFCLAAMLAAFVAVIVVAAGMTVTAWRDTGVTIDAAGVVVLCILAGLVVVPVRAALNRREARHYDMQRPWLPTVEQAQADERLRQQVARYAEQKRRTATVTGEHAAVRFP